MGIVQKILGNTKLKSFQTKNGAANGAVEAVFNCMVEHGFPMPRIRKSLRVLNGIKLAELANGKTSVVTASNTIAGRRPNRDVKEALASGLGLDVERLFPENG